MTVFRWVQRFTPLLIGAATPRRHVPGDRWFVDETYVEVVEVVEVVEDWLVCVSKIDQFGQLIDVLVSEKRDLAATRRFFTRTFKRRPSPTEVQP